MSILIMFNVKAGKFERFWTWRTIDTWNFLQIIMWSLVIFQLTGTCKLFPTLRNRSSSGFCSSLLLHEYDKVLTNVLTYIHQWHQRKHLSRDHCYKCMAMRFIDWKTHYSMWFIIVTRRDMHVETYAAKHGFKVKW